MKSTREFRRSLFAVTLFPCVAVGSLLVACASDESADAGSDGGGAVVPTPDAGLSDAETDGDAAPCTDCEWYPEECSAEAFCPNGLFDPTNPTGGWDWRTRINVLRGRSSSDVWLAGAVGTVAHFDGSSWTASETGVQDAQRFLWLPSRGEVVFGSFDRIFSRGEGVATDAGVSAGGWSAQPTPARPAGTGKTPGAAWAAPDDDLLWLATETELLRLSLTPTSTFEFRKGIDKSVCEIVPCAKLRSLHGATRSTIFAVGDVGAAVRISEADGESPSVTALNSLTWNGLTGVWAASDTDVWAVGGSGTVRHYTGDALRWEEVSVPTNENLNAVWGSSPKDVWAVGNAGIVLHYDGTTWSRVKVAGLGTRRPDLHTVWSSGPDRVFVAGEGVLAALGGNR